MTNFLQRLEGLLPALLAVFRSPVPEVPDMDMGDEEVTETSLMRAIKHQTDSGLGAGIIEEATYFVEQHWITLSRMTKEELLRLFNPLFKNGGKFDDAEYRAQLKYLDYEALVARIEHNTERANAIIDKLNDEHDLTKALSMRLSIVARFVLAKAISLASHGVL